MYTYILKSHDLYKIGKAVDIKNRLKSYDTHNPYYTVVKIIDGNIENKLHKKFKEKRIKGEWFNLDEEDIKELDNIQEEEVIVQEKVIRDDKHTLRVKRVLAALLNMGMIYVEDYRELGKKYYTSIEVSFGGNVFERYYKNKQDTVLRIDIPERGVWNKQEPKTETLK